MIYFFFFFFFKQKTAYEITVRDWSSDVCSSDLILAQKSQVLRRRKPFLNQRASPTPYNPKIGKVLASTLIPGQRSAGPAWKCLPTSGRGLPNRPNLPFPLHFAQSFEILNLPLLHLPLSVDFVHFPDSSGQERPLRRELS